MIPAILLAGMDGFPTILKGSEHLNGIAKANNSCSRHEIENYLHSLFIGHTRNSEDRAHITSKLQNCSTDQK